MKTKSIRPLLQKKLGTPSFAKAYEEAEHLLSIGVIIADTRTKKGWSQAELAEKLGTAQSVISRIEHGNQNLSVSVLTKIARVLNCDLSIHLRPYRHAA